MKSVILTPADATALGSFNISRTGTGTREWSDHSYNIALGCSHNCHYCYARFIARRFGRIATMEDWRKMTVDPEKINGSSRNFGGVVMFPTTHDITPELLPYALQTLKNLLGANNEVLVVTKPHLKVIKTLCTELVPHRSSIQYRFTIGSLSAQTCALWEPGAPAPAERLAALEHAYAECFRTSISIEPMLGENPEMIALVSRVTPFVTDSIWLGKLNGGVPIEAQTLPGVKQSLHKIRTAQKDPSVLMLHSALKSNPKVRWKDSIKRVLKAHGIAA
jgi:hypothetical protein